MVAGFGFGCLMELWVELLTGFVKGFASRVLCSSVAVGGLGYFILCNMPPIINIVIIGIGTPVSLGLLYMLTRETPPAPFVSRKESLARHRLSFPIDTINTVYCVVFGLAMQRLFLVESSLFVFMGASLAIIAGAVLMIPFLGKNTSKMMHGKVQQFLFPFLVLGLLPMPFVPEPLQVVCILILLACFVCLTIVCTDSLICLVKRYDVASFYLIGRGMGPILTGVVIGYCIGVAVSQSHLFDSPLLPLISLGLAVLLSLIVTFVKFDKDYLAEEDSLLAAQSDAEHAQQKGTGNFKARCALVAEEAGLSSRQVEVFLMLAKGHRNVYIQEKLCISSHTVKAHVYNIYKKLEINSREELIQLIEEAPLSENTDTVEGVV